MELNLKKYCCLLILSLVSVGGLSAGAADFNNQLNGVKLRSCNSKKAECIEVKFQKSEMSQWTQIFAFSEYEAKFISHNSKRIVKGHFGYLDLDQNKIVLRSEKLKDSSIEILIDLTTLSKKEFSL